MKVSRKQPELVCPNNQRKRTLCDQICLVCFQKSFASADQADSWSSKNTKTARQVFKYCNDKFIFDCHTCKHEYSMMATHVARGHSCSYCNGDLLCDDNECQRCFDASFASHTAAQYWNKSNSLSPRQVRRYSNKKYEFNCGTCPHQYQNTPSNAIAGNRCPFCAKKSLCDENCEQCFNASFAAHPKATYFADTNTKAARQVMRNSAAKYDFICPECLHCFVSSPAAINRMEVCPFCTGSKLCGQCEPCFKRSFASHQMSHFMTEKNSGPARLIAMNTKYKAHFCCGVCSHEYYSCVSNVSTHDRLFCPYCTNHAICLSPTCERCYNKSFATHPMSTRWSSHNPKTPRETAKNSTDIARFDCDGCQHSYEREVQVVARGESFCPYCTNRLLCTSNDCMTCYKKSFASHPKSCQWSVLNTFNPRDVSLHSERKAWFDCDKCKRQISKIIHNVTIGTWCPHCTNKTEARLYDWLIQIDSRWEHQKSFSWSKTAKSCRKYDFYLEHAKILIELGN